MSNIFFVDKMLLYADRNEPDTIYNVYNRI